MAEFLSTQPKLTRLAYPGLKSHPQHELAVKQQKGFGSMMSFDLGTREAAGRFLGAVKMFLNAESLGGVESLASHSATTTHAALSEEDAEAAGDHRGAGAAVGRDRGQGRFDCGSGAGAGGGVNGPIGDPPHSFGLTLCKKQILRFAYPIAPVVRRGPKHAPLRMTIHE